MQGGPGVVYQTSREVRRTSMWGWGGSSTGRLVKYRRRIDQTSMYVKGNGNQQLSLLERELQIMKGRKLE